MALELLLFFSIFFAAAFFWPTYRLWRRERINALVLPYDDSAHGMVGRWFRLTLIGMFFLLAALALYLAATGRSVPMHTHGGSELTLILRGAYRDAIGHFAPGDVADLDSEVEHQPVTVPGVPCICVAATDAPLRFSGWMARLLQPLVKL